jgi:hypothetical protein
VKSRKNLSTHVALRRKFRASGEVDSRVAGKVDSLPLRAELRLSALRFFESKKRRGAARLS